MTMPRRFLVDVDVTRYYHCISRCVRRAFLCGDGFEHRKTWIESRLEVLATQFAVSVCGFAIMDNHLHVLCRLDPGVADDWSDEEVVRRWIAVYPPAHLDTANPATVQVWVNDQCKDASRVATYRQRLQDLGWFMKALKEPLARMANREDDCTGTFWEARYKSIAILDDEALLATCAYIDLNPVAAGIASTPETSEYTSIKQRIDHVRRTGVIQKIQQAAEAGSVAGATIEGDIEQSHWLCPMQDRSTEETRLGESSDVDICPMQDRLFQGTRLGESSDFARIGDEREGMLAGFSLASYLELVDWTARLCRTGKARLTYEVVGIMQRLGTDAECWQTRIQQFFNTRRWRGSFCTTDPRRLKAIALRRGLHHINNAIGAVAFG